MVCTRTLLKSWRSAAPVSIRSRTQGLTARTHDLLAVILKELQPDLKIAILEKLESAAQESSNAWNNAGTGHAALCESNYTPPRSDGSIDISKALQVNTEFDLSRQFWAYLVKRGRSKTRSHLFIPYRT